MEKQTLIRRLRQDEPPYVELAAQTIELTVLEEIIREGDDELKNRVVSLLVLKPDLNPVALLHLAYTTSSDVTKAVTVASISKIDQEYLDDPRIKAILEDALESGYPSLVKFAVKVIRQRRRRDFTPLLEQLLQKTTDPYVQHLLSETLNK